MDKSWEFLKKLVFVLLFIYFVSFLIYTDFLFSLFEKKPPFDFSRYFFKILNLE